MLNSSSEINGEGGALVPTYRKRDSAKFNYFPDYMMEDKIAAINERIDD